MLRRFYEDSGGFGIGDYIHAYGDPKQAVLLSALFWPELTRVEGHLVLQLVLESDEEKARLESLLKDKKSQQQDVLSGYKIVRDTGNWVLSNC